MEKTSTAYQLPFDSDSAVNLTLIKAALDSSVSGIIITDNQLPDNPIIYCNKSFEVMTGYNRRDIIGHNCRFLQADDREQIQRQQIRDAIKNGESVSVEIRNYRKDGELFWNELYVSPIKSAEGNVTHFVGVQHDVTRRRKAEDDLRQEKESRERQIVERTAELNVSREYLESIVQTVRESLLVLDPDLQVISVNQHFLNTFKVGRSETEHKSLYDLGNGQWNIPRLRELLEKILPTNNPVLDFEVEHNFPHIGKKLMLLNAHRIELEGEYKDRILLAIEDITERRAIEQRKDDFLSVASHELKTPLTTIKGYIQIMERLLPPESSDKLKDIIKKTAKHADKLNNLIKELLEVSRIQTGNITLVREPFYFDHMVNETIESLQAASSKHKIILNGKTGIIYNGDESQLSQVVSNLLSNALKYSPEADHIDVYLAVVSNYIKFSVTDYGLGISPADQKKIFERFYRSTETQKNFPGMGIGLYICEQIIKNHGGSLWVNSEYGKGSTFNFTLPIN
ncbi:PAS domain-containing protein [Mucilaginibacter sp. KACC 22063]|uniref:PAS domain-containing protein n=1 Tax=Mucilaginibacter sp. KACC 22063 TaxID=3025666 RepID=UPI002365E646|nr:PAS domain-containing protein [Mucilaginibacter sp. KACC 22063]WDF53927.1 PAS domain-containing protein [Mucilaginibacter sp. KACC 22063]